MAEIIRRFRPTPTDAYLANPHRGICTFQRFNGDPLFPGVSWSERGPLEFPERAHPDTAPGYLPSTVAYCRWFWRAMEPEPGCYDFAMIERALATAEARGQTLAVRLMAYDQRDPLPEWYASRYAVAANGQPDHDSEDYFRHWGALVREFGRRFDGDPRLESIDVAFIGWWGEGDGVCSAASCRRFAELWRDAFPTTPRLALIAGDQMRETLRLGGGWRADCYGDLNEPGSACVLKNASWNHMYEAYPAQVAQHGASESWRVAPVHLETCWVPMHWYRQRWDIDFILEQGLKYHTTYFMPKSSALPEAWLEKFARFCDRLGYRYVLRNALVQSPLATTARAMRVQLWIENVGVAPLYRRYDLAVKFRQGEREHVVRLPEVDIRSWLPGDAWIDHAVPVPPGLKPGWADLAIGLLAKDDDRPRVRFAVREQYGDGWASIGGVELT